MHGVSSDEPPAGVRPTLETIPTPDGYLYADPVPWGDVLAMMPGLKVGLVWAGRRHTLRPEHVWADSVRSMRLTDMLPLLDVPGCSFVSLQLGEPAAQLHDVAPGQVLDVAPRLRDWADTAGLVAGLDLVVTVDTAVVHLAGALGRPVWMLDRAAGRRPRC